MRLLRCALMAIAICLIPPAATAPAAAASGAAPAASSAAGSDTAALKQLLATLQDPAQRDRFIADLKTLIAAREQPPAPEEPPGIGARALDALSAAFARLSGGVDSLVKSLADPAALWNSAVQQFADPARRSLWIATGGYLALILLGGGVARLIASLAIQRAQRRLRDRPAARRRRRLVLAAGRFALDLIPIVAFAATSLALVVWTRPPQGLRLIVLAIVNATTLSLVGTALARLVLAPDAAALRVLPLADETAAYLYIWLRRVIVVVVWGYLMLQAALLLHMSPPAYIAVSEAVGALVAGLALVFIWQNRHPVAAHIRGTTTAAEAETAKTETAEAEPARTETAETGAAETATGAAEEAETAAEKAAEAAATPPTEAEGSERPAEAAPPTTTPLAGLRARVAGVWHILATIYVLGVYAVWALGIPGGLAFVVIATAETAAIVSVLLVAEIKLRRLLDRFFAVETGVLAHYPPVALRAARYVPVLRGTLLYALRAAALIAGLAAWRVNGVALLTTAAAGAVLGRLAGIAIIIVLALLAWEFSAGAISAYLNRTDPNGNAPALSARARTLLPLVRNILLITISVMAVLAILAELGVNIAPLLAGAGVAGLAIGVGAQSLVKDVITGAFILFEGTLNIGDVVQINGQGGLVEGLTVRTIRLRDLSGNVLTIPFGSVTSISNMTKEFSYYLLDIGVAYREDTDEVVAIMREVDEEMRADAEFGDKILEPLEVLGVDRFADSAVYVRARTKTRPVQQWNVGREFNRRLKHKFDERGIEMPFPHRTIYFGEGKSGTAPPAHIVLRHDVPDRPPRRTRAARRDSEAKAADS
jgi:small conductance mechanosensitive channel